MSQLRHISVGKDGAVWGADDLNRLWRRSGSSWTKDQTAIGHLVAVGDAQHVWCVNDQGEAFHLDQGKWQKDNLAKNVRTISVASDGTVWCGNRDGKLFRRESNTWIESPDAIATVVAVGGKDQVWCLNAEGEIFQLDSQGKWQKDSGASGARTLSVGADGTVWYGNAEERLFRREGNAWQQDPDARATVVAVGGKDHVWCVNKEGDAFQRTAQGKWQKVDQPKGSWEYKVKQNDGLYAIVRQQFNPTDEKEVQRIAGLVVAENHIKNKDQLAVNSVLKLLSY